MRRVIVSSVGVPDPLGGLLFLTELDELATGLAMIQEAQHGQIVRALRWKGKPC